MSLQTKTPVQTASDNEYEPQLWKFVPLSEYQLPAGMSLSRATMKQWSMLKGLFRSNKDELQVPAKAESELRSMPQARLENLAPPVDWKSAVAALDVALTPWLKTLPEGKNVQFVIGQPFFGHQDILTAWANKNNAAVINAPPRHELLKPDPCELSLKDKGTELWVMPSLEQFFLRHASGLDVVRRLLEQAASGHLGAGLIGCDSWAWEYLKRIWPFPVKSAFTLQSFDGDQLTRYFAGNVSSTEKYLFCHAKTGECILPSADTLSSGDYEVNQELKQLALHCRGNLGTAWSYWRNRLRSVPEADHAGSNVTTEEQKTHSKIWISSDLVEPDMPLDGAEDIALVLHALLIHNGLSADLLAAILPLSTSHVFSILLRLQAAELICCREETWQVVPLGYATVRRFLVARGYLADSF